MNMARFRRGILVFLAGFSLLIIDATKKKPLSELVKTHAEPGRQNEQHFHEVSVDQEQGGKESDEFELFDDQ